MPFAAVFFLKFLAFMLIIGGFAMIALVVGDLLWKYVTACLSQSGSSPSSPGPRS